MRFFLVVLCLVSSFASARTVGDGGMDSGGGTGLPFRLKRAGALLLQVLAVVEPEMLATSAPDLYDFYRAHRADLLVEAARADVQMRPSAEVYLDIDGRKVFKRMITELRLGAPVYVSDDFKTTAPLEIAENLLHEFGHHLGVAQSEDAFLDRLSVEVVERAVAISPALRANTSSCAPPEELIEMLVGRWRGTSALPWQPTAEVELTFNADGHYVARILSAPPARSNGVFYYGDDDDVPDHKIRFLDAVCGGGFAHGQIALAIPGQRVWWEEIRALKVSDDGQHLSFEMMHAQVYGPIVLTLERQN